MRGLHNGFPDFSLRTGMYGLFLWLLAGLSSCGTDKPSGLAGIEKLFAGTEDQFLLAKPTLIRSEDLGDHGYVVCVDSLLLISTNVGEYLVTVYNLHDGRIVNRLAPKGKAKNEFLMVADMVRQKDRVMIFGKMPSRAVWIDNLQLLDSFPEMQVADFGLEEGDYLSVAPVFDGKYIATGRFDASGSKYHQFASIGSDGNLLFTFDDYLLNEEIENLPNYNLAYGYQGRFAITPDGTRGLYCGWNSAVWRFYDFCDGRPRKIEEYAFVLPSFAPRAGANYGVVHSEEKSIGGSIFAVASDKYYYLLFSGKPYGPYDAYFTDRIYVFDLEGRPVRKIKLDREIIAMAYWEERNALLGCANGPDGEPQILEFDL